MKEKTAKALYALLKELYKSPAAKEFVDEYEREQRHEAQAVPLKWSREKDNAYHDLTEAIFKREPLLTIQKAAETFVDICRREERVKPKDGEIYRDIFGNRYIVIGIHDSFPDGEPIKKPLILLARADGTSISDLHTVPLEDFMNSKFKKE